MTYRQVYEQSIENREDFWKEKSKQIQWFEEPSRSLEKTPEGMYRWYPDGMLNTSYLTADVHVEQGFGDNVAIYYDSPVTNSKLKITFSELKKRVSHLAGGLKKLGLQKGDTAVIYMPMIPETVIAMLACARLGAIHSVVFGGFAPKELAARIDDAKPKVILTASCGIEFTKVINYFDFVEQAMSLSKHKVDLVVVKNRAQMMIDIASKKCFDFEEVENCQTPADPVPVESHHPLYILYTSGTTGKPKGIQRDNGGHAVMLKHTMEAIYNTKRGEVFWAASDVGWVVGHSYIVYGPLIQGCSTIVYEGKPIKTPDAGAFWRVMSEYKVKSFFTAPTAFRAIKKEDDNATLLKNYDTSNLEYVFLAGERLDPPTYNWLNNILNAKIIDNWWQTEQVPP